MSAAAVRPFARPAAGAVPPRERLDRRVFAAFMAVIGDRLGRQLEEPTLRLYYAELSARLDTAAFDRGARALFDADLFAQWPSVDAICEAAGITATPHAVPDVDATARYIAAGKEAEDRSPYRDQGDEFASDWRTLLAHCKPEPKGAAKAFALAHQPLEATPWRTAPGAPNPREVAPIHTAERRPAPRRSDFTSVGEIAARVLTQFAPTDSSDAD